MGIVGLAAKDIAAKTSATEAELDALDGGAEFRSGAPRMSAWTGRSGTEWDSPQVAERERERARSALALLCALGPAELRVGFGGSPAHRAM